MTDRALLPGVLINVFGQPKELKTITCLQALVIDGHKPVLIGVRENLEALITESLDMDPDFFEIIDDIRDMNGIKDQLEVIVSEKWDEPVYIDDINHKIHKSYFGWDDSAPVSVKDKGGKQVAVKDGFFAHGQSKRDGFDVFEECRNSGLMVLVSAHEASPDLEKSRKGGPVTPNYEMRQQFCSWFDINLRFYKNERDSLDPYAASCMYGLANSTEWLTGDRYEKAWDATPRSIRELLRAAGRELPYPKELRHIETIRDAVVASLRATSEKNDGVTLDDTMDLAESLAMSKFESQYGFPHMRWGLQEGVAAFLFEERLKGRRTNFRKKRRTNRGTEGGAAVRPSARKPATTT